MSKFLAAAVQMRSGTEPADNMKAAETLIREAAAAGATYVLTPEVTNVLDLKRSRLFSTIRPEATDPSLAAFRALAAELGIVVHLGSLALKGDDDKGVDRSLVIDASGDIVARYDKIHMFDVDLEDGESYRESSVFTPGDTAVLVDLPQTRLGLSICYDVRFPYLFRTLAKEGATVFAVPAAFTRTTGEAHWHVLTRARAIENGAYVVAAAQGGTHQDGRQTYGHSMIIDPWGKVLAEAENAPGVILAEIDPAASEAARRRIPALTHDRAFEVETVSAVRLGEAV